MSNYITNCRFHCLVDCRQLCWLYNCILLRFLFSKCYILLLVLICCFQSVTYLHFVWITPVQMVATMYLLWIQLGVTCFVPLALMILMILYQSRLGRVFAVLRWDLHVYVYKVMNNYNSMFSLCAYICSSFNFFIYCFNLWWLKIVRLRCL